MGGEWTAAAALIAETWRPEHRGKALGLMQSAYAIGRSNCRPCGTAGAANFGWQRGLPGRRSARAPGVLDPIERAGTNVVERTPGRLARSGHRSGACSLAKFCVRDCWPTTMNTCGLFGYWACSRGFPEYLSLRQRKGAAGSALVKTTTFFWCYARENSWDTQLSAFSPTHSAQKALFHILLIAALLVPIYGMTRNPTLLLLLGPLVAFFGTGFFSGYARLPAKFPWRNPRRGHGF